MRILLTLLLSLAPLSAAESYAWKPLFNGKDLTGWQVLEYGGAGPVEVKEGKLIINSGVALSGIRRTNDLLKTNYEVLIKAAKLDGQDFFCGLTFPVGDSHASLIVGGWGGSLVGISSLDGMDASENETSSFLRFDKDKSYEIKLRVTESRLQTWIDQEKLIDVSIRGRKVSMRPGEIEDSVPFGISTYQTTAAISEIAIRPTPKHIPRISFLAGRKSHGPGEHEYEKSLMLLQGVLDRSVEFIDTQLHREGWPLDEESLLDSDCIVLFSDGSDHDEKNHPLLVPGRMRFLDKQAKRGAGIVALHYSVFVPQGQPADYFLDWVGGYFDYQSGDAPNKWFSKIETRDFKIFAASPDHPVSKGWNTFEVKEEYYFKMKFAGDRKGITPIATFDPQKQDWEKVVAWARERENGGRGFACTGGHFHKNFEHPEVQRMLLNAILWAGKVDQPLKLTPQK